MDTEKVKNYDADEGIAGKNMTSTVSATETTGMMYNPPHDREELSALRDMHQLQATEFAAAEFGENEPAYPHERRTANAGYGRASSERYGESDPSGSREKYSADGSKNSSSGDWSANWHDDWRSARRSEAAMGRENRSAMKNSRTDGKRPSGNYENYGSDTMRDPEHSGESYRSGWHERREASGADVHHPQQEGYGANLGHEGYSAKGSHEGHDAIGDHKGHDAIGDHEGFGARSSH